MLRTRARPTEEEGGRVLRTQGKTVEQTEVSESASQTFVRVSST